MDYGRAKNSGAIVHVAEAIRGVQYVCPTCGLPLELRRGDDLEYFAHWRGLPGTQECELFTVADAPSPAGHGGARLPEAAVEDEPSELGLIIVEVDGQWEVGLRLPEIPRPELGDMSLAALRGAYVDVFAGPERLVRVGALELRPGVGAARVGVAPRVDGYAVLAGGSWPATIKSARWQLQSSPLNGGGTLFRLRGGEWTRLAARSGVHHGETLLVVAERRSPPPQSFVRAQHGDLRAGGSRWGVWEICLPATNVNSLTDWLSRAGHSIVPRPWGVELAAPARAYSERGDAIFWVGDAPVIALHGPQGGAEVPVWLKAGTNSFSASVKAVESGDAFVSIKSHNVGSTRLTAVAQRRADIDVTFLQRPSNSALLDQLTKTPRLRVWLGAVVLEAWRDAKSKVALDHQLPEVRVDLGAPDARVRVTTWDRGKQRTSRGLDARNAARVIAEALPAASRIEVDADNFGRVEIIPTAAVERRARSATSNRLAWFDHVVSLSARSEERATRTLTTALLDQPRASASLAVRPVGAAALVRSRQALRRRHDAGGDQ